MPLPKRRHSNQRTRKRRTHYKLTLPELQELSPLFEASVLAEVQPLAVMEARSTRGGTGSSAVKFQLEKARARLSI